MRIDDQYGDEVEYEGPKPIPSQNETRNRALVVGEEFPAAN
jgi:hypothetical protein